MTKLERFVLRGRRWGLAVLLILAMPGFAAAQEEGGAAGGDEGTPAAVAPAEDAGQVGNGQGTAVMAADPTPPPGASADLRVLCTYRAGSVETGDGAAPASAPDRKPAAGEVLVCPGEAAASLGTRIYVRVSDLRALLDRTPTGEADCRGLVLFLGGAPLEGIAPTACDLGSNEVAFDLRRKDEDDEDWHELLGRPLRWSRAVRLTVGPNADFPLPTDVEDFELVILTPLEALFFLAFLVVSLTVFFRLAATTPMLKDSQAEAPKEKLPYSLARSQMAWWFFLAATSYLLIWLVIGELDTLPASVLGLIGISAATAVAATGIDSRKKVQEEQAEAEAAEASRIPATLSGPADAAEHVEARVRSAQATRQAERLAGSVKGPTRGSWLLDVLSDGSGVSFHRFQVVGWTVLLGLIFLWEVYTSLTMPDFSATLLGLMGISSGTYLGLKLPERPGR